MGVSRRLRYEILSRDEFRCRACGRTTDEAVLEVDHVIPEALGGQTKPSNLQTLCEMCNGGKSSVQPDAAIVAEVADDAERWAHAMQIVAERRRSTQAEHSDFCDAFIDWMCLTVANDDNYELPNCHMLGGCAGYRSSMLQLRTAGLSKNDLQMAMRTVMRRIRDRTLSDDSGWKYFFGIAWGTVRDMHNEAAEILRARGTDLAER